MRDLNTLVDPTGPLAMFVTLTSAQAINDDGWTVALGVDSRTGSTGGYLLAPPVPLPAGVVLLLSGLLGLGVGAKRRRRWSSS